MENKYCVGIFNTKYYILKQGKWREIVDIKNTRARRCQNPIIGPKYLKGTFNLTNYIHIAPGLDASK
jgi:hypothetical protein